VTKLRFLPEAAGELLTEVSYYSAIRVGLGIQFADAVEAAISIVLTNPNAGSPAQRGTRRRIVKDFPFSIIYRPSDAEILIVALAHHRRKPGYWKQRTSRS